MFNIEAARTTSFTCGKSITTVKQENDPRLCSFVRNCLRSHKENVEATLPDCAKNREIRITPIVAANDEKKLLIVPKAIMCALESKLYTGVYYAFLMTHPLHGKKTSANVGYSTNPTYDLYLHNNLLINDRTTSAAAPYWILDIVLGPFISIEKAIECCSEWVSNTRGIESKRKRAVLLARIYAVSLYSIHTQSNVPLKKYLAKSAPSCYMDSYRQMTGEEETEEMEISEEEACSVKSNKKKI